MHRSESAAIYASKSNNGHTHDIPLKLVIFSLSAKLCENFNVILADFLFSSPHRKIFRKIANYRLPNFILQCTVAGTLKKNTVATFPLAHNLQSRVINLIIIEKRREKGREGKQHLH